MRLLKILLTILVICGVSILLPNCSSDSESADERQVTTVQRGNLSIDITGVGNLALSQIEDLAVDIFYSEATVEAVLVEEGDTIEEGQELVKLDTSEWDDELNALQKELVTAKRNLITAEGQIATKELAVRSAELDLEEAQNNLYQTEELKAEYDSVETAKFELRVAQETADWQTIQYWQERLTLAEEDLDEAMDELNLTDPDDADLELAKSLLKYDKCLKSLEDAKLDLDDANLDLEDAEQDVEDVQSDLDEAESLSPIITAPFDGFVTKVNVEGGDEVLKGTVAVQIADPNKFEAEIMVSEMDILDIELDEEAQVSVDAIEGITLPAEVTHISPTATISQGVVNYEVKVEVGSLSEMAQEQQAAREETMQNIQSGELPEQLKQAIEEGQITQEQAEEMIKRMQEGPGGQQSQAPTTTLENFQLREGLTVTVSIIVDERNNVLLVPNSAITTQGRQTFVQVLAADGTPEQRTIQIGISDYQYTEVTDGLSEGEQIIVPEGTTTTSSSSSSTTQQGPGGGIFMPGMGGGPPR